MTQNYLDTYRILKFLKVKLIFYKYFMNIPHLSHKINTTSANLIPQTTKNDQISMNAKLKFLAENTWIYLDQRVANLFEIRIVVHFQSSRIQQTTNKTRRKDWAK